MSRHARLVLSAHHRVEAARQRGMNGGIARCFYGAWVQRRPQLIGGASAYGLDLRCFVNHEILFAPLNFLLLIFSS
jgi:hypothetical protein